ncbi:hypothetical protein [Aquimarina sp. AU474]|uniref:hypothetical protein n=1 Tax=Aquimarina sp. AU474 TaxID=2108529 RepID=UPI000D690842|nr:hypothetical protein [Aquimarina sp. AU474]
MDFNQLNRNITDRICKILESKAARYTQIVVVVVISFLIILDIYLFISNETTVSETIHSNAKNKLFVITWIWGILGAHLFVCRPKGSNTVPELLGIAILLVFSVGIFLLGKYVDIPIPQYMHAILLVLGGVSGYYLWAQELDENKS